MSPTKSTRTLLIWLRFQFSSFSSMPCLLLQLLHQWILMSRLSLTPLLSRVLVSLPLLILHHPCQKRIVTMTLLMTLLVRAPWIFTRLGVELTGSPTPEGPIFHFQPPQGSNLYQSYLLKCCFCVHSSESTGGFPPHLVLLQEICV